MGEEKYQCINKECGQLYAEYVNGCPACCTGKPEGSRKVVKQSEVKGHQEAVERINNIEA